MSTLLLVCEDLAHNRHWAELLSRVTQVTAPVPRVLACDWAQASTTLAALRRQSGTPGWVVLQTRFPEPSQWRFLNEVLQMLDQDGGRVVFWTASQRRPEALKTVALGGDGFLPLLASESELCDLWHALQASGSLLPACRPEIPQAYRRSADPPRVPLPGGSRSYASGRACQPGQRGKPSLALERVMEALPALHWVSAGQRVQAPKPEPIRSRPGHDLPGAASAPGWHPDTLSPRKREVFERMVELYTYKEIARQLQISAETVKDHARAILDTSGCRHRLELVARWAEWLRQQRKVIRTA